MLADRTTIMSGSFPSFMSVFGSDDTTGLYQQHISIDDQSKLDQHAFPFTNSQIASTTDQLQGKRPKPCVHRGSVNSSFTESTESSPTTTNSTFDSPLVSDNSASSSPESATSLVPSSPFRMSRLHSETSSRRPVLAIMDPIKDSTETSTSQDPPELGRNAKKLTLDMSLPTLRRPATAHGGEGGLQPFSAPTSPLKEPIRSARKKPTNLTIRTPGFNQLSFNVTTGNSTLNVPPTPSQRPALHAYQSSPALSYLASPTGPPAGGMFLPIPSFSNHAQHNSTSSNGSSSINTQLSELREEETQMIPKSQETPERGYTEGPVCIYDNGVYLYLEPTAEEASKFDTVINVAKEVKNPFKQQSVSDNTIMSVWRTEDQSKTTHPMEPPSAISDFSFKSAFEFPRTSSEVAATLTTPTQSSFTSKPKYPEYLHVIWDHNSEILEDLLPLCQLIDQRTEQGKKVLIHCQLGVSRSASLIIAYGLYKGYQADFHSMYMAVKERSRWVGPNMSLIYQLTDFRRMVADGKYNDQTKQPKPEWFEKLEEGSVTPATTQEAPKLSTLAPATPLKETETKSESSTPGTGLVRRLTPLRLNKALPPVPLFATGNTSSPGVPTRSSSVRPPPPSEPYTGTVKRAASRPLPLREKSYQMTIPAHKPKDFPGIVLPQSSAKMDLAMQDVPETPSIFSPRATEFVAAPFGVRGAGDLVLSGNRLSQDIPKDFSWLPLRREGHTRTASKDPRSPHLQEEPKEMFRHIDEYL